MELFVACAPEVKKLRESRVGTSILWIFCALEISYVFIPFEFLFAEPILRFWSQFYYFGHVLPILFYALCRVWRHKHEHHAD